MEILNFFLPEPLSHFSSGLLIFTSFLTSALTAAMGLGGGVALITVMASVMPIAALVPVHGVVQIGSNAGRALVQVRHVDWQIAASFAGGAVLGAGVGGSIAVQMPGNFLKIGIAAFVLWTVWGKTPVLSKVQKPVMGAAGFASTFLSMFFGAAGPIGGAVLSTLGLTRHQFVANQAITALTMHIFKILAFGLLGFAFAPWIGLITLMVASGFLGTLAGSKLLGKMDEVVFKRGFKLVMTFLAINLLFQVFSTT